MATVLRVLRITQDCCRSDVDVVRLPNFETDSGQSATHPVICH